MKKGKKRGPSFWISPQETLIEAPTLKPLSKFPHRRCNSGMISPYGPSLIKVSSSRAIRTRQNSPKPVKIKKNLGVKTKVVKKPKKKVQKKKKLNENKLNQLHGNVKIKAPKIYKNQIFRDVYDAVGNHDRVMETIDVSESLPEIVSEPEILTGNHIIVRDFDLCFAEYEKTNEKVTLKNPASSFLQETKDCNQLDQCDLFKRLSRLSGEQDKNIKRLDHSDLFKKLSQLSLE